MFSRIGMPELIVILLIILFLFGAKKLPEIVDSIGKAIRKLRETQKELSPSEDNSPDDQKH